MTSDDLRGPNPPNRVRVTETNDSTIVLHAPKVVGDTLVGFLDSTRRAFPLSGTTEIDAWAVDPGHTGAAIIFGGSLAALAYLVIQSYPPSQPPKPVCVQDIPGMVEC